MLIRPSSIRRRLMALAWVGERPSASCCMRAEGHTIGRLSFCQSCGCVKRNSQSSACTRRGAMPRYAAAALKAARWTSPLELEGLLTNPGAPGGKDGGEANPTELHE